MRLYLSSFGLGNQPDHLRKLVNGNNALIILNALDHNETVRSKFLKSQTEELNQLGFKVSELDLRDYFGKANQLEDLISNNNLVWINSGFSVYFHSRLLTLHCVFLTFKFLCNFFYFWFYHLHHCTQFVLLKHY